MIHPIIIEIGAGRASAFSNLPNKLFSIIYPVHGPPIFRLPEKVYPKVYEVNFTFCIDQVTESSDFSFKAHRVGAFTR